jgi:hypothetical protein
MRRRPSRPWCRVVLIALSALAAALTSTSPVDGRVLYPGAQSLSAAGQLSMSPQVAIDAQGRARVVWAGFIAGEGRIQTVRISADGTPGAIQTISPAGESAVQPQLAVDPQGGATVIWRASGGGTQRIRSVRLAANGAASPVITLASGGVQNPRVALDSQSRTTAVWQRTVMGEFRIEWVRLGPNQGAPVGPFAFLSTQGGSAQLPQLAIDSQDRATVVWHRNVGAHTRVQARRIDADGTLGPIILLSAAGQSASFPHVAVDPQDRATAVWYRSDGTHQRVQSLRFPGSEVSQTLSPPGGDAIVPRVAIDPQGRATVVWLRSDGSSWRVQSRQLGADGVPTAVRTLSAAGEDAFSPRVAVDARGRASAVWSRSDGDNLRVQSVRLRANGVPGAVGTLSAAGRPAELAEVAIDPLDRPIVVWQRAEGGGPVTIEAARGGLVPPDTQITAGPAPGQTTGASPVFRFAGVPAADADRFECRVDAGAFAACSSPHPIGPLADGPHTFAVRAIDSDGADPTPAQRGFTVDVLELKLSGKRKQRLRRAVTVRARCDQDCELLARGRLVIRERRSRGRGSKKLSLRPARAKPTAGARVRLRLKTKTRAARVARRALRRGGTVRARLRVTATNDRAEKVRAKRTVRLKLRSARG